MKLSDLTRDQLLLLNTDFGADIEKTAEAIVNDEMSKVAELQGQANELYSYGAELAMQKIAEMEENYKDEAKKEGESEEEEKDEEKKEEEKTASAMGNYILEGYWNTLMEKGAEYYGDKNIYLEELVKVSGAKGAVEKVLKYVKNMPGQTVKGVKGSYTAGKRMMNATTKKSKEQYKQHLIKNLKKAAPGVLAGTAVVGGTGYGIKKALDKK